MGVIYYLFLIVARVKYIFSHNDCIKTHNLSRRKSEPRPSGSGKVKAAGYFFDFFVPGCRPRAGGDPFLAWHSAVFVDGSPPMHLRGDDIKYMSVAPVCSHLVIDFLG